MKIKLTPRLAYLIGLWKARKTKEGIGVSGKIEIRDIFLREVLGMKLTEAKKVQVQENMIFFYHSAYRAFFQEVVKNQIERFKYKNEYAARYLAGMFDGFGGMSRDKKHAYFAEGTFQDEMLLLGLGFKVGRRGKKVIVGRPKKFLAFIRPYLKYVKI